MKLHSFIAFFGIIVGHQNVLLEQMQKGKLFYYLKRQSVDLKKRNILLLSAKTLYFDSTYTVTVTITNGPTDIHYMDKCIGTPSHYTHRTSYYKSIGINMELVPPLQS